MKEDSESMKRTRMQRGIDRKDRMLRLEEEKRRQAPILSETEVLERQYKNRVIANAKAKMDEGLDDVKDMNQMVAYAQCVTIRDAQIREKARMQSHLAEANREQDLAMEVDRVKQLRMHQARDRIRAEEQRIGAQVIIQQIQEREAARLQAQERQDQEARAMIERQKELQAAEQKAHEEKILSGKKLMAEVLKANEAQSYSKFRAKQKEIEEDQKIAQYIREKEAREAAADEEKERLREAQELELKKLRQQNEKASNRQAQIDELRAKRYQEAKDRSWRQQQLEKAKKKETLKEEIARAREQQRREKAMGMASQALQERAEYERVLEWQKNQALLEEHEQHRAKERSLHQRQTLYHQITEHDSEKKAAREAFLAEGREIALQQERDRQKLLRIKEQKLRGLQVSGVPEKYIAELAKKKVLVTSIH